MSVFDNVYGSLRAMSSMQLLFAFVTFASYALAQGAMLAGRGRRVAWTVAATGAAGFLLQSEDWPGAVMLIAFAIAGLGLFVATVWLLSRLVGLTAATSAPLSGAAPGASGLVGAVPRGGSAGEHAPSAGAAG